MTMDEYPTPVHFTDRSGLSNEHQIPKEDFETTIVAGRGATSLNVGDGAERQGQEHMSLPLIPTSSSREDHEEQVAGSLLTDAAPEKFGSEATPHRKKKSKTPIPGRENRWVTVMDRSHDGRKPQCDMKLLNNKLMHLAAELAPTQDDLDNCKQAFEVTREALLKRWPEANVILFGSFANGLSVRSSNDIDVCLHLPWLEPEDNAAKESVVQEAATILEEAGMEKFLVLPKARVPVVKCVYSVSGTKIDVTVNNILACINTKMIADYCRIDHRLVQLVSIVKHWAKCRSVNDPYTGTLSSYCYVLMCIFHLQTRAPPILPILQALPPTFSLQVGEWQASFFSNVDMLAGFGVSNNQNLAELIWEFFEYWAWKHDYANGVVSIRIGSLLSKESKGWVRRLGNERHLFCVEDPFILSHDLGRTVDPQTRDVLRKEFWRAATLLRDFDNPFDELFEAFKKK